nr:MAG TPA: hypothetical protein [Caudoviricetes sp.]
MYFKCDTILPLSTPIKLAASVTLSHSFNSSSVSAS